MSILRYYIWSIAAKVRVNIRNPKLIWSTTHSHYMRLYRRMWLRLIRNTCGMQSNAKVYEWRSEIKTFRADRQWRRRLTSTTSHTFDSVNAAQHPLIMEVCARTKTARRAPTRQDLIAGTDLIRVDLKPLTTHPSRNRPNETSFAGS